MSAEAVISNRPVAAPSRLLMSGNEAVARAIWEAGVRVAAAYPGTPATDAPTSGMIPPNSCPSTTG